MRVITVSLSSIVQYADLSLGEEKARRIMNLSSSFVVVGSCMEVRQIKMVLDASRSREEDCGEQKAVMDVGGKSGGDVQYYEQGVIWEFGKFDP
ncbi:hypothetical protein Tco_0629776 [Tanacetum coccineum]|uniref:Uncharacterized protein n=1 Tax=Tanacetum coccineum TaxID=301880 RepID=A0ABQ4WU26_9ASTR